jgi:wyosine [tRNA(Phe)-imidazoG37] synthetase (radical SAM superfamily)
MNSLIRIVRQLANTGVREIIVSGAGEPLLHPDINALLSCLIDLPHLHRRLYTNGSLLHKHPLVSQAFNYIRVSMDAGGEKLYSELHKTNPAAYAKIFRNLAAASSVSACGTTIATGVSIVINNFNAESCGKLVQDCEHYGINYLLLKPTINGFHREPLPTSEVCSSKVGILVRHPVQLSSKSRVPEELAAKSITLTPDSQAYPCCHLTSPEHRISKLDKITSFLGTQLHRKVLETYSRFPHACRVYDYHNTQLRNIA